MTRPRFNRSKDDGFALGELLIALLLLSTAAAGVAELCLTSARSVQRARLETMATTIATQKMEQLLGLAWAIDPSAPGSAVVDQSTDLSADPPTVGGQGLNDSPPGSLDGNTAGYVDYLDGRGQWLGTGPSPSARAVHVRRWQVQSLPSAQGRVIALRVFVTPAVSPGSPDEASRVRRPGDVLLTTVRARKAF